MAHAEDALGDKGTVSGSIYAGDHAHYHFLGQVFDLYSHANVLQRDMYPSATKFEGEIIAMTSDLLHGTGIGVVTSGGSESLMTALYSYREEARAERGVTRPNLVMPVTAHCSLDKGAHWMDVEMRHAPSPTRYVADVAAMADLVDDQTVAIVGSAGNYAHGLIDPIEEMAELARSRGIGLHVDGCLGGWLLPWVERLGYDVPPWDFRVPGVTSISADTHKYGYALKGSSVLLYRERALRKRQYFTFPTWPGGLYVSPGFAGSRSGGILASTWAALVATGESGYLAAADAIMRTATTIKEGIREIPELEVIGDPLFLIAFKAADDLDIYLVNDSLIAQGWRMIALQKPPACTSASRVRTRGRASRRRTSTRCTWPSGTRRTTKARRRGRAPCTASRARRSALRWSGSPWPGSSMPCTTCPTTRDEGPPQSCCRAGRRRGAAPRALDPRRRPRQRRTQGGCGVARRRGPVRGLPPRPHPHRARRGRDPGCRRVVDGAAGGRA